MTPTGQTTAVSVIVPVYNPGPFLRPLLDALDDQKPVPDGFDVILVDDGSTDGTGSALDRWCAARPWARVIHQPNSGWPSRPRNVGIAASRAEFVFLVDQDDRLTPNALADLVAFARDAEADVILGRMRGEGRKVPTTLFAKTVRTARAPAVPLPDSMTPHAMFRRQYLLDLGLRFDEEARRLEDHLFLTAAYTGGGRVSVFSDSDIYVHVARTDGGGAGYAPYDPGHYYRDLSRAIAIAVDALPPGRERDSYLNRWVRVELVGRLRSDAVRWMPQPRRDAFFAGVRDTLAQAMPPGVVDRAPAPLRWSTALALTATPDEFLRAEDRMRLSLASELRDLPGTAALAGLVSPESLRQAVALLGSDEPLPDARAAASPAVARRRRLQRAVLALTAVGGGRLHPRLVAWGRTPLLFARQAGAVLVPVLAVVAFLCALQGADAAATVMVVVAAVITAALSVRSTSGAWTALCQLLCLVACAPLVRSAGEWAAMAAVAVLIGAAYIADRIGRRRSVRAHAGVRVWRRPGTIVLVASALAVAISAAAIAVTVVR